MLYKNRSSSKSCVKLRPRNMVNIIFSAFLNCEFCDRYSSKFVFKVSNCYLREYFFVAVQSHVFFPLLNILSLFFFFFSVFHFSINSQLTVKACVRYFLSSFYLSPNDSPSKTVKNIFHFI